MRAKASLNDQRQHEEFKLVIAAIVGMYNNILIIIVYESVS